MKKPLTFTALASLAVACSATDGMGRRDQFDAGSIQDSGMEDATFIPIDVDVPDINIDANPSGTPDGPTPNCTENCPDFPADPIFDAQGPTVPPANAPELFGDPDNMQGTGPCVFEPQLSDGTNPGALFPANWLRPRFRFEPIAGENLWEIRLSTEREANDLVVYTTSTSWAMPLDIWKALANNVHNEPVTVTIRGVNSTVPATPSGSTGSFQIAPVFAGGSMVYWAATSQEVNPNTSKLVGFRVGDEGVVDALTIPGVGDRQIIGVDGDQLRTTPDPNAVPDPGYTQCIGCHVSTPDGKAVAFTDVWPWNNLLASVEQATAGDLPAYVTPGAERLLNQPWLGMQTLSKAHWTDANRIVVTTYGTRSVGVGFSLNSAGPDRLAWFNLATDAMIPWTPGSAAELNQEIANAQGTAWGLLTLTGETGSAVAPGFSHDGMNIVYTSVDVSQDARIGAGNANVDLHVVPYSGGAGGMVTPLAGAAEAGVGEYYPSYSANDELVAFNRVSPLDAQAVYYRADGEIFVIGAEGGTAQRLAANDPPVCGGETSPGVINSWAKWSPGVVSRDGKSYYWLIFSSARAYEGQFELPLGPYSPPDRRASQLYMTGIVEDETTGDLSTFSAVYLWNQDPATSNLTPAWDEFKIPPVPPPQ